MQASTRAKKIVITPVCKDFLRVAIAKSESLDILCSHWAPEEGYDDRGNKIEIKDLPSWIPKLSGDAFMVGEDDKMVRKNADALVGQPAFGKRNYSASGSKDTVTYKIVFGPDQCSM